MAVGLWIAPFVVGQVADRWLAIEKVLATSHFVGGISLYALAMGMDLYSETAGNFQSLLWLVGIFAVAYIPTVPLVSALCFRHLPDPGRAIRQGAGVGDRGLDDRRARAFILARTG